MKLGVYFGWHTLAWEELRDLVQQAEELGYQAAFVDGDISMLERRADDDCLDGWTVTTALLAATRRIEIGSLRLVHHWHAAKLAQAVATAERLFPGRLRFQISIGDWAVDARFGPGRVEVAERSPFLLMIRSLPRNLDRLRCHAHVDAGPCCAGQVSTRRASA